MRSVQCLSAFVLTVFLSGVASGQTAATTKVLSTTEREALRRNADAVREKNAREREEIQKNFIDSSSLKVKGEAPRINDSHVCRATIAALMGRDPKTIKVIKEAAGVMTLSYQRPADGSVWSNRCKINGNTVLWASLDGRWRDDPRDEKITFSIEREAVSIRQIFSDGSGQNEVYPLSAFGP